MTFPAFGEQLDKMNLEFESAYREMEKIWENMGIPEKHLRSIFLAIDKLALKYGWVSNWDHFTPAEIDDLLKEWSDTKFSIEEQEQMISKYFVDYYSAHNFNALNDCITKWNQNPIFNRRNSIFRDCLYALQSNCEFFNSPNLVVPVLISQIDGFIGELLEHEGWSFKEIDTKRGTKEKRWVYRDDPTIKNSEKNSDRCFGNVIGHKRNRFGITGGISDLIQMNSRYEVVMEGLFQPAYHGDNLKNPSFISRHKILHGEDIEYGTPKNAIKLFLILDYLSEFTISNLTEPDDSKLVEFRKLSSFNSENEE